MVYGVTAALGFTTAARRDAVFSDIETRVANKPRWGVTRLEAATIHGDTPGVLVEMRFTARADADDLLSRVDSFATGQRTPTAGSYVVVHNCPHDDGNPVCVADARRDW